MKKRIIDYRTKEKFQIDDEYLNGYARLVGWKGTLVYVSLCRHANKDQEAFPSIELMSEELDISRDSIIRGVKDLTEWNIISVEERTRNQNGVWKNNFYGLLDKSCWKNKPNPSSSQQPGTKSLTATRPSRSQQPDQVAHSDSKDTHTKDTHMKETPLHTPPEGGWVNKDLLPPEENLVRKKEKKEEVSPYSPEENKQISEVINEFRKINPTIKFYRKDHRSASYEMIKNFGIEKVKGACALAIAAYGKQYAPVITTPSQLNEKFSQLFAYYKANGGIALSGGESLRAAQEVLDTRALLEGYSKQIPIGHLKGCVEQLEATDENIQELISVFRDAGVEISPTSPGFLTAIHEVLRSIVGKKTIRKVVEDFTRRKDEILGLIEEDRVKKAEKEAKEAEQAARPDVIKRKAELQVVIEREKARIAKENAMKEAEAARWRALRANNRT